MKNIIGMIDDIDEYQLSVSDSSICMGPIDDKENMLLFPDSGSTKMKKVSSANSAQNNPPTSVREHETCKEEK